MEIIRKRTKEGERRERRVFLWLPRITITEKHEIFRWLELAWIREVFHRGDPWVNEGWSFEDFLDAHIEKNAVCDDPVKTHLVLGDTTDVLLEEIADKSKQQRDIAFTYALAIRGSGDTDWAKVNQAIIERWSKSGLERIKKMAWNKK